MDSASIWLGRAPYYIKCDIIQSIARNTEAIYFLCRVFHAIIYPYQVLQLSCQSILLLMDIQIVASGWGGMEQEVPKQIAGEIHHHYWVSLQ